jgi:hypothetical protein
MDERGVEGVSLLRIVESNYAEVTVCLGEDQRHRLHLYSNTIWGTIIAS